jgi:hypothetical protein
VVSEAEDKDARNNNARLQCVKKGDLEWQPKETSPKKRAYAIGSPSKETHPNNTCVSSTKVIGNGLFSPLPIWQ